MQCHMDTFMSPHRQCMCNARQNEDLWYLHAESWYPGFVLLMVLFRFYYSEYLPHLYSPRRLYLARRLSWSSARYSFPFSAHSSPSIGHSDSFKLLPPLVFFAPFSFFPRFSSAIYFLTADKWSALRNIRWFGEDSHPAGREGGKKNKKINHVLFCRIFFLMKHKKAIKLR